MKKVLLLFLCMMWMVAVTACADGTDRPSSVSSEGGVEMTREQWVDQAGGSVPHRTSGVFHYKTVGDLELTFYLMQPAVRVYEEAPLVVNFVGGGWTHLPVKSPILYLASEMNAMSQDGFAQMTVTYRGSDHAGSMSDCLGDLMDAFSYISLYNDVFGIDLSHIALVGQSAGGHVALMLQLAPEELLRQSCQYPEFSYRFCGTVTINAPTMLYMEDGKQLWGSPVSLDPLFGGVSVTQDDTLYRKYSPITYVRADMNPVLLGIGTADNIVLPKQSYLFYQKAQQVGAADVTKMELQNAGHGFEAIGGTVTPSAAEFNQHAYQCIRQWMGL